jgi:UDP-N-acetyl-D-galactosamine dehydrogenase
MITIKSLSEKKDKIAVVGLGYVGLPLAVHLSKYFEVTGYDLKEERIQELRSGYDRTLEIENEILKNAPIYFTCKAEILSTCRLIIVAVPTPIDEHRIPNLHPLRSASEIVGRHLAAGSCVVFESTVYPGATEEVCVPIIEKESGLRQGIDFTVGYSPERINPGDKKHSIENVVKIISGSDKATVDLLAHVYGSIVKAGLHRASSIKVAEAAKVIENTQRDLNIALMNELAMIFDKMDIDTTEVLEAAGTKWNFLPFRPGLVGGHCIGVDPYYLTFKAEYLGYHPEMILAGRRINDSMGKFIADRVVKILIKNGKQVQGANITVLGLTFKEDVPDLRNTRVIDIIKELKAFGIKTGLHDPLADPKEALAYYGLELSDLNTLNNADAVIIAVKHRAYIEMGLAAIARLCKGNPPLVADIKGIFSPQDADDLKIEYWRL